MKYHIGVDVGASSGRLILSYKDEKIISKEIHRFKNSFKKSSGKDRWDIAYIIDEILKGLVKVKKLGISSCSLGIDTWAVDYVLLGNNGKILDNPVSYRDKRTEGIMDKFFEEIPKREIYEKTGIQFLNFNTIYQLFTEDKKTLEKTKYIMMIPDYISYYLTGKAYSEVTNSSTGQYLNIRNRNFDEEILSKVGIDIKKFPPLIEPGEVIGDIKEEFYEKYDLPKTRLIAVASHDTASAIVGIPAVEEDWAYISSGTWSLIGIESDKAFINEKTYQENYTNEWGVFKSYRVLKNITGMWIIQKILKELPRSYSYEELKKITKNIKPFSQFIDLNDQRFLNPKSMIGEIKDYCIESNQKIPESIGEIIMSIYSNLALKYALEFKNLEKIRKRKIKIIHIVGGGSAVEILNQLTANLTACKIYAGPKESTGLGNISLQMIAEGEIKNLQEARKLIKESVDIKIFEPEENFEEVFKSYEKFIGEKNVQ